MGLKDAAKHRMLNHLAGNTATAAAITHVSAHTAYPATGANEVTGGSPAYARQVVAFEAAAGTELAGSLDVSNSPVFDIPGATSVAALGFWTAVSAGTLLADSPAGSGTVRTFSVDDAATDVCDSDAHGFADGDRVVVYGSNLPTGLTNETTYFVRDSTTNSFKLATTSGGAAIDLTSIGDGLAQKTVVESFAGQGTYTVTDADISLNL